MSKKYKKNSYLRKPNPGMIFKAAKKFNIDLNKSLMIGDKKIDMIAAKRANVKYVMKKYNTYVNEMIIKYEKTYYYLFLITIYEIRLLLFLVLKLHSFVLTAFWCWFLSIILFIIVVCLWH